MRRQSSTDTSAGSRDRRPQPRHGEDQGEAVGSAAYGAPSRDAASPARRAGAWLFLLGMFVGATLNELGDWLLS